VEDEVVVDTSGSTTVVDVGIDVVVEVVVDSETVVDPSESTTVVEVVVDSGTVVDTSGSTIVVVVDSKTDVAVTDCSGATTSEQTKTGVASSEA
jgi:hypothetical protein